MVWVWLIPWLQFVPAFLTLDLFFRYVDVAPEGLARRLRGYSLRYAAVAMACSAAAGWGQWQLAGSWGLVPGLLNTVPWWLLWRFGLRKQLTHLFKDDGGHAVTMEKPDP
ncbi:MAG TPA: hypothetical protein VK464_05415 [Symbiobacteriaceae bacterium]|nr:hypothetical protein [Symbiobacteriaceae bacterium]